MPLNNAPYSIQWNGGALMSIHRIKLSKNAAVLQQADEIMAN
jgi:hypothetical protein